MCNEEGGRVSAYYNEVDPYAAQWLRNLIAAGHIAKGDVDERSIIDVRPADLAGYAQCHFFAGIGGWSCALRLAGWDDARPVWTGSCPCQPFSAAGAGKAADDERHLWPAWFSLIAKCRPAIVFGEQVEAAIGWGWLDVVFADLESQGYACGAAVFPTCSVGAPHIRQRCWFVADSMRSEWGTNAKGWRDVLNRADARRQETSGGCKLDSETDIVADATNCGSLGAIECRERQAGSGPSQPSGDSSFGLQLGDAESSEQFNGIGYHGRRRRQFANGHNHWVDLEWLSCTDGKARPTKPGLQCLAHGVQRRASKLRAFGNAIVPQVAAEFIKSTGWS
jgi:DNA (cytosine-5)-methyltransferase 1